MIITINGIPIFFEDATPNEVIIEELVPERLFTTSERRTLVRAITQRTGDRIQVPEAGPLRVLPNLVKIKETVLSKELCKMNVGKRLETIERNGFKSTPTALPDIFFNDLSLRYWKKILDIIKDEEKVIKRHVAIKLIFKKDQKVLACHYSADKNRIIATCSLKFNYIAVLGGILFEAENARRGNEFRKTDDFLKTNKITPIEAACRKCAIEYETYLDSLNDYINIILRGGVVGPQEWRNMIALYTKMGVRKRPWECTAQGLMQFSCSSHNIHLSQLNSTSFYTYLGEDNPFDQPDLLINAVSQKIDTSILKQHPRSTPQKRAGCFLNWLYTLIDAAEKKADRPLLDYLVRWKIPSPAFDILESNIPGKNINMKAKITLDNESFKNIYHTQWRSLHSFLYN